MNIDYLANLIESADVAAFRTIATLFLRSTGYKRGFYSDGPYDGGVDFFVLEDATGRVVTAFQLSVESKWRVKLEKELKKAKSNYPDLKSFVFVSKRRIPLNSIRKINTSLVQQYGLSATHYDNQAIATEFIDKNLVSKLYELLGITAPAPPPKALVTPRAEAASALLLFGGESDDFRAEMTQNLILAELRKVEPVSEAVLADSVVEAHGIESQRQDVVRAIRRLVQAGRIEAHSSTLRLCASARDQQDGVRSLAAGELEALKTKVKAFLSGISSATGKLAPDEVLDELLRLSVALWRRFAPHPLTQHPSDIDETFHKVSAALEDAFGPSEGKRALTGLADIVAKSDFAKRLAAAELYYSLVRTNSSQLVAALGGSKGLLVLFDTPVLIPLLCGLLFDKIEDHAAYSARQLIDLLKQHRFTALAPNVYVEEAAAHLVDCARNYRSLLFAGEDLTFSANAFASHFSQLKKIQSNKDITFDDYISIFGAPPSDRFKDLSDSFYYPTIEKIAGRMSALLARYAIEPLSLDDRRFDGVSRRLSEVLDAVGISRAPLLIAHDSRVVGYLEGTSIDAGFAKVLCTWDSVQLRLNPTWDAYCVMNPASVTDLLTLLRSDSTNRPMTQLIDFVWLQTEDATRMSARVWDEIVAIEQGNLADGVLLAKARAFRQSYIDDHKDDTDFDVSHLGSLWLKWKQTDRTA